MGILFWLDAAVVDVAVAAKVRLDARLASPRLFAKGCIIIYACSHLTRFISFAPVET